MSSPYSRLEKHLIQTLREIAASQPSAATVEALTECLEGMRDLASAAVRKAVYGR